jgi:antitoxin component of MazEF toxin-antitoxin module
MSLLQFRRTINHYGKTNYVNIPPVLVEMLKAEKSTEVFVEDDLEHDCVIVRFIRGDEQNEHN